MGQCTGQMGDSTRGSGKTANSTEEESTEIVAGFRGLVNGRTERKFDGFRDSMILFLNEFSG